MAKQYNDNTTTYSDSNLTYNGETPPIVRSVNDSFGLTDNVAIQQIFNRSVGDSFGITDVLTGERNIYAFVSDTIGLTEVLNRQGQPSGRTVIAFADTENIRPSFQSITDL